MQPNSLWNHSGIGPPGDNSSNYLIQPNSAGYGQLSPCGANRHTPQGSPASPAAARLPTVPSHHRPSVITDQQQLHHQQQPQLQQQQQLPQTSSSSLSYPSVGEINTQQQQNPQLHHYLHQQQLLQQPQQACLENYQTSQQQLSGYVQKDTIRLNNDFNTKASPSTSSSVSSPFTDVFSDICQSVVNSGVVNNGPESVNSCEQYGGSAPNDIDFLEPPQAQQRTVRNVVNSRVPSVPQQSLDSTIIKGAQTHQLPSNPLLPNEPVVVSSTTSNNIDNKYSNYTAQACFNQTSSQSANPTGASMQSNMSEQTSNHINHQYPYLMAGGNPNPTSSTNNTVKIGDNMNKPMNMRGPSPATASDAPATIPETSQATTFPTPTKPIVQPIVRLNRLTHEVSNTLT